MKENLSVKKLSEYDKKTVEELKALGGVRIPAFKDNVDNYSVSIEDITQGGGGTGGDSWKLWSEAKGSTGGNNAVYIGEYNSATHYRSYLFGRDNVSPVPYECMFQNQPQPDKYAAHDDGFTYAFGMANSAIRNYDMAIGLSALASGGENIVIGTPKVYITDYQYQWISPQSIEHIYKDSNGDQHTETITIPTQGWVWENAACKQGIPQEDTIKIIFPDSISEYAVVGIEIGSDAAGAHMVNLIGCAPGDNIDCWYGYTPISVKQIASDYVVISQDGSGPNGFIKSIHATKKNSDGVIPVDYISAIGYRNINIRSNVYGIGNIVIDSQMRGSDTFKKPEYFITNDMKWSTASFSAANDDIDRLFSNNIVNTSTIDLGSAQYVAWNTFNNTQNLRNCYSVFYSNIINDCASLNLEKPGTRSKFIHNIFNFSCPRLTGDVYENIMSDVGAGYYSAAEIVKNVMINVNHDEKLNATAQYGAIDNNFIFYDDTEINASNINRNLLLINDSKNIFSASTAFSNNIVANNAGTYEISAANICRNLLISNNNNSVISANAFNNNVLVNNTNIGSKINLSADTIELNHIEAAYGKFSAGYPGDSTAYNTNVFSLIRGNLLFDSEGTINYVGVNQPRNGNLSYTVYRNMLLGSVLDTSATTVSANVLLYTSANIENNTNLTGPENYNVQVESNFIVGYRGYDTSNPTKMTIRANHVVNNALIEADLDIVAPIATFGGNFIMDSYLFNCNSVTGSSPFVESYYSISENTLFGSHLSANYGPAIRELTASDIRWANQIHKQALQRNFLVNASANTVTESFIVGFGDPNGTDYSNLSRVNLWGYRNVVRHSTESLIHGCENTAEFLQRVYLFGNENKICMADKIGVDEKGIYDYASELDNTFGLKEIYINGFKNEVVFNPILKRGTGGNPDTLYSYTDYSPERSRIIGNMNRICPFDNYYIDDMRQRFADNFRYGNNGGGQSNTIIGDKNTVASAWGAARNYLFGTHNAISGVWANDSIVLGAHNIIASGMHGEVRPFDYIYGSNTLIGDSNSASYGSNNMLLGAGNLVYTTQMGTVASDMPNYGNVLIGDHNKVECGSNHYAIGRYNQFRHIPGYAVSDMAVNDSYQIGLGLATFGGMQVQVGMLPNPTTSGRGESRFLYQYDAVTNKVGLNSDHGEDDYIFVVGNGQVKGFRWSDDKIYSYDSVTSASGGQMSDAQMYNIDNAQVSNAMVVNAAGTVSATKHLAISGQFWDCVTASRVLGNLLQGNVCNMTGGANSDAASFDNQTITAYSNTAGQSATKTWYEVVTGGLTQAQSNLLDVLLGIMATSAQHPNAMIGMTAGNLGWIDLA